jgi:hypothetical protein
MDLTGRDPEDPDPPVWQRPFDDEESPVSALYPRNSSMRQQILSDEPERDPLAGGHVSRLTLAAPTYATPI